ncbi:MAG: copper chaperone PCu(A)C [Alphaproteobacteria bacterium]|nr:copper chaperone PCu(A)C [Alphaproteobacteria bacterium]
MRTHFLVLLATLFFCNNVMAHEYETGSLTIHHPYAYSVQKNDKTSWAFMNITNDGEEDDTLVSASSPIAGSIDIFDGESKIENVDINSHQSIKFKKDGIHLVLNDIKKTPIKAGARRPIMLHFEHAGDVKAQLLFTTIGDVSRCDDSSHNKKPKTAK